MRNQLHQAVRVFASGSSDPRHVAFPKGRVRRSVSVNKRGLALLIGCDGGRGGLQFHQSSANRPRFRFTVLYGPTRDHPFFSPDNCRQKAARGQDGIRQSGRLLPVASRLLPVASRSGASLFLPRIVAPKSGSRTRWHVVGILSNVMRPRVEKGAALDLAWRRCGRQTS